MVEDESLKFEPFICPRCGHKWESAPFSTPPMTYKQALKLGRVEWEKSQAKGDSIFRSIERGMKLEVQNFMDKLEKEMESELDAMQQSYETALQAWTTPFKATMTVAEEYLQKGLKDAAEAHKKAMLAMKEAYLDWTKRAHNEWRIARDREEGKT